MDTYVKRLKNSRNVITITNEKDFKLSYNMDDRLICNVKLITDVDDVNDLTIGVDKEFITKNTRISQQQSLQLGLIYVQIKDILGRCLNTPRYTVEFSLQPQESLGAYVNNYTIHFINGDEAHECFTQLNLLQDGDYEILA